MAHFIGTDGTDTLIGTDAHDRIEGLGGGDFLVGHDGKDFLYGGEGDDYLDGGRGKDTIFGGDGFDRASFADLDATQGIIVDLVTQTASNDGYGNAETMTSIEAVGAGTIFADSLTGNDEHNFLWGGLADTLMCGGGDDDIEIDDAPALIDGGDGVDTIVGSSQERLVDTDHDGVSEIEATTNGVNINLAQHMIVDDGWGNSGSVLNVENAWGSNGNDTLVGDGGDNVLYSFLGDDVIKMGAGNDTTSGGGGVDKMSGGTGADHFEYYLVSESTGDGYDTITDFTAGEDKIDLLYSVYGVDETVEAAKFGKIAHAADADHLQAGDAVLVDVGHKTFLVIDANYVAGYQAGEDYLIRMDGVTGITTSDFGFI